MGKRGSEWKKKKGRGGKGVVEDIVYYNGRHGSGRGERSKVQEKKKKEKTFRTVCNRRGFRRGEGEEVLFYLELSWVSKTKRHPEGTRNPG